MQSTTEIIAGKKTKQALSFFAVATALLMVFTLLIWGFQSDWGAVKIKRISILGDNGSKISAITYIPRTVSNETPAPGVVIYHGRSNQGHSNDTWSMELARRGYVVISPDLSGGGESDVTGREPQAASVANYMFTLPFVDRENVVLVGYSAGCASTVFAADHAAERVKGNVFVFGPFMLRIGKGESEIPFDSYIIKAKADQYDYDFLGDPTSCLGGTAELFGLDAMEYGVTYTRENGHTVRMDMIGDALHQTGNMSAETISYIVRDVDALAPAANKLAADDLVFGWQQFFSLCAAFTMIFFVAALANLLLSSPYFGTIKVAPTPNKGIRGKKLALRIVLDIAIPVALFVHVSAYTMKYMGKSNVFTSNNLNGIMGWLMVLAIISIVGIIMRINKAKKNGESIDLADYALGASGESKIVWSRLGKSLLMAITVVAVALVWLSSIEGFLGINYQFWNFATMLRPSSTRIVRSIPYVLLIFIAMLSGGIGMCTTRRLPETGRPMRDAVVSIGVNALISAACLAVLLIVQYGGSLIVGTGQTLIPQIDIYGTGINKSSGALDFAFGYCFMMGTMNGTITYLYRKCGTIWPGVILGAIFAGIVTMGGFTLVR